jgi:hypothetical protein
MKLKPWEVCLLIVIAMALLAFKGCYGFWPIGPNPNLGGYQ